MRSPAHTSTAPRPRRRPACAPRFERLEDRRLMATSIVETPLSGTGLRISGLARAADGSLWAIDQYGFRQTPSLQRVAPDGSASLVEGLPVGEMPADVFAGRDGDVWVLTRDVLRERGHLVRFSQAGTLTKPLPRLPIAGCLAPDGDVWMAFDSYADDDNYVRSSGIIEYDVETGRLVKHATGDVDPDIYFISAATDGTLWYASPAGGPIGTISKRGKLKTFDPGMAVTAIEAGPNGTVWLAGERDGQMILARASADGQITHYGVASSRFGRYSGVAPESIVAAADDSIWFLEPALGVAGRLAPDGSTSFTPLPSLGSLASSLISDGGTGYYFASLEGKSLAHLSTDAPEPRLEVRARSFRALDGPLAPETTIATFTTPDPSAWAFDFIARYQIDGQEPRDGVVLSDGLGGFVVRAGATPDQQVPGAHLLTVTILDAKRGNVVGEGSTSIAVATIADPPVEVVGRTFRAVAGSPYNGQVASVIDPAPVAGPRGSTVTTIDWGDGSPVTVAARMPWLDRDAVGAPYPGHKYAPGTYTVTVTATHNGQMSVGTSTAIVSAAPLSSIRGYTAGYSQGREGRARVASFQTWPYQALATDYSASVAWAGGSVDGEVVATMGGFEVWATMKFPTWGSVPLMVSVTPEGGESKSVTIDALVTPPPISARALPIEASGPGLYVDTIVQFTSFDPASKPSDYRATVETTDGGSWSAEVVADGEGGYTVFASHVFLVGGSFDATLRIDNVRPDGAIANGATLPTTASVAFPVAIDFGPSREGVSVAPGRSFSGPLATFTPGDPSRSPSDYSATVDWGDGTTSPGTIERGPDGRFVVSGEHVYASSGSAEIKVSLQLVGGGEAPETTTIPVVVTRPTLLLEPIGSVPTLNVRFEGAWARFKVPGGVAASPSDFVAVVSWDDGSPDSEGRVVADGLGGFLVESPHTFADGGARVATVQIRWADAEPGDWATVAVPINVAAPRIFLEGKALAGRVGAATAGVVATFVDAFPNDLAKYRARIEWGDGRSSVGSVSIFGGGFVVYGSHEYAAAGAYSTRVTIENAGSLAGSIAASVVVAAAPAVDRPGVPAPNPPVGSPSKATVTSAFAQFGPRRSARLLLNYSGDLEEAAASDRSRYTIFEAGKDGRLGTKDDRRLRTSSIRYDKATRQVTLVPRGTFARSARFQVAIRGEVVVRVFPARR